MCALLLALAGFACSPARKTGYLDSYKGLETGQYVDKYWSDGTVGQHARISVDLALYGIEDRQGVTAKQAEAWLIEALIRQDTDQLFLLGRKGGGGSARMEIALTRMSPGKRTARIWLGEFGVGGAEAQIEGRIIDNKTGHVIARFAHRERVSAPKSNEYADVRADDGPNLVKRNVRTVADDLRQQLALEYARAEENEDEMKKT